MRAILETGRDDDLQGLAARPNPGSPNPSGRRRGMKDRSRLIPVSVAVLTVALVAVAVAGAMASRPRRAAGTAERSASAPLGGIPGAPGAGPAGSSAPASSAAASSAASGVTPTPPASQAQANAVPALPSKVVKTGSASVQVGPGLLGATMASLTGDATGLGGYVSSSSQTTAGMPTGDITLRVPADRFERLVAEVQALGKVTGVTTSGQDVTAQSVDLQARIQALQDTRTQFEQILTKAVSIGDILSVEQQISDLQTRIDQLQGQLNVLDDQAAYSTFTVHVSEKPKPGAPAPKTPGGLSKAWGHTVRTFTHGVENVVGALGGIAVFLLFAGAVAAVARVTWLYVRRRAA